MTKLHVDNIVKKFGGVTAVDGASFTIQQGSITGLIGPYGAGKTTTFNIIAGALKADGGQIVYNGASLGGRRTHQLYHMGIVRTFQIPHEFGRLTVLENLMTAAPDQPGEQIVLNWLTSNTVRDREAQVRRRAEETLEFLGLSPLAHDLANTLSGGQKKLLELGRTMMNDADLVLLDEPGAGVNPTLLNKISQMIRTLNTERGYTFCIIEHDMDLISSLCDPVVVMAEGKVLTEGSMEQVRGDKRVIDAYFGGATDG